MLSPGLHVFRLCLTCPSRVCHHVLCTYTMLLPGMPALLSLALLHPLLENQDYIPQHFLHVHRHATQQSFTFPRTDVCSMISAVACATNTGSAFCIYFSFFLLSPPTPSLPPFPFSLSHSLSLSLSPADIISTVEFNHDGEFLATGDKGGRVVIFQRDGTKMRVRNKQLLACSHTHTHYTL